MSTWNPSDYAQHSSAQQVWARELIAKLHLRGDERVLDIGCGDGKVTAEIATAVPRGYVLGTDNSPDMIAYASATHQTSNLRFQVADASALPFKGEFDVIFSNACLHWIYDHRPVLAGIRRALAARAGGRGMLQMGGRGNAAEVLAVVDTVIATPRWEPFFRNFTFRYGFHAPDDYRRWLIEAGLRPIRVELVPKTMHHAGREGLLGWFRTTWLPYLNAIPAEHRDQFLDQMAHEYLIRHPPGSANDVQVAMVRLEVECDLLSA